MTTRHASPESAGPLQGMQYVLCRSPRVDESAELLTVFDSEKEARHALMKAHGDRWGRAGWAQVVAIDPDGDLTVLAWFGRPSPPLVPELGAFARARTEAQVGACTRDAAHAT